LYESNLGADMLCMAKCVQVSKFEGRLDFSYSQTVCSWMITS
jgi:hypothetical protein